MAGNGTVLLELPMLPKYTLEPQPPLLFGIPDAHISLASTIITYWVMSLFFHIIDEWDLFPQYRLHTPAELLKRNHATRWDVFRDVILQQIIQTIFGLGMAYFDPVPLQGKENYDIAVWATRLRVAQKFVPYLVSALGVDPLRLSQKINVNSPTLAGILRGGRYPQFDSIIFVNGEEALAPGFAPWELNVAKLIYWIGIPALQFAVGTIFVDTWQYLLHRAMHMNHWLYTKFHARHHRLYVPYAYGALYNHPVEGFMLDTLGTGLAYLATGMTPRQSIIFFTFATAKTVDDHCGYALPWDPLQHISGNNATYHDIHHQSWGIKTNFSQPFFTFWDRALGTMWKGGDIKLRYERSRKAADEWWEEQKRLALEKEASKPSTTASNGIPHLPASTAVDGDVTSAQNLRRSPRKGNSSNQAPLKGLSQRMSVSLPNGVPRVDSKR